MGKDKDKYGYGYSGSSSGYHGGYDSDDSFYKKQRKAQKKWEKEQRKMYMMGGGGGGMGGGMGMGGGGGGYGGAYGGQQMGGQQMGGYGGGQMGGQMGGYGGQQRPPYGMPPNQPYGQQQPNYGGGQPPPMIQTQSQGYNQPNMPPNMQQQQQQQYPTAGMPNYGGAGGGAVPTPQQQQQQPYGVPTPAGGGMNQPKASVVVNAIPIPPQNTGVAAAFVPTPGRIPSAPGVPQPGGGVPQPSVPGATGGQQQNFGTGGPVPPPMAPPPSMHQKLKLKIRAKDLVAIGGGAGGTKCNPYAVVTVLQPSAPSDSFSGPVILGKTETVYNTLNPDWTKTFTIDYSMGQTTKIIVSVLDENGNTEIGSASFDENALVGAPGNTLAKFLKNGGMVFVSMVKPDSVCGSVKLALSASQFKSSNPTPDTFWQLSRRDVGKKGSEWIVVHRSNVVRNSPNPTWEECTLNLGDVCVGADLNSILMIAVVDSKTNANMGQVQTSVNGMTASLRQNGGPGALSLYDGTGVMGGYLHVVKVDVKGTDLDKSLTSQLGGMSLGAGGGGVPSVPNPSAPSVPNPSAPPSGDIAVGGSTPSGVPMPFMAGPAVPIPTTFQPPPPPPPTFTDYLQGGCEIQLSVAIDFTSTNGNPTQPGTLHYVDPTGRYKNDYVKVISAIGKVLENYDTDKQLRVWGFGAKFNGQLFNLFQCGTKAEVNGIPGVLQAYKEAFTSGMSMSGPTAFTQVIDTAAAFARKEQEEAQKAGKMKYSILLIVSNGDLTDVPSTLESLRKASDAPLSIVVVGVGNGNFTAIENLDDYDDGNYRDVLQFVEFNLHRGNTDSLTRETLMEIPGQLSEYFQRNCIKPLPPKKVNDGDIPVLANDDGEDINLKFNFGANGDIAVAGSSYSPPPSVPNYGGGGYGGY